MKVAGFPRESNTYLCNNVTFVTGYLMNHSRTPVRLLRAQPSIEGAVNEVSVATNHDFATVPRVFVHWPADMAGMHHAAGAAVMTAMLDAQLSSVEAGERPAPGDNALADSTLQGGETF